MPVCLRSRGRCRQVRIQAEFLFLGDLLSGTETLHTTRASEHTRMPVDDTSETSRNEVLSNVSYTVDDYSGSVMVNYSFSWKRRRRQHIPLPINIVAGGGALDELAWNGVAVGCGRERSVTRTCRWSSLDSVKNLACPKIRVSIPCPRKQ